MVNTRGAVPLGGNSGNQPPKIEAVNVSLANAKRNLEDARTELADDVQVVDEFPANKYGWTAEKANFASIPTIVESISTSDKLPQYYDARQEYIYESLQDTNLDDDGNPLEDKTDKAVDQAVIAHKELRDSLLEHTSETKLKGIKKIGATALDRAIPLGAGTGVGAVVAAGSTLTSLSVVEGVVAAGAAFSTALAATRGKVSRKEYKANAYVDAAARSTKAYISETLSLGSFADDGTVDNDATRVSRVKEHIEDEIERYDTVRGQVEQQFAKSGDRRLAVLQDAIATLDDYATSSDTEQLDRIRTCLAAGLLDVELLEAQNDDLKETRKKRTPRVVAVVASLALTGWFNQSPEAPTQEECEAHYATTYDVNTGEGEILSGCSVDQENIGENGENTPDNKMPADLPEPNVTDEDPSSEWNEDLQ